MKASTNIQQIPRTSVGRGAQVPVLTALLLAAVLAILLAAGCAESPGAQQAVEDEQQNEELQQRLDELEEQQDEELQQRVDELEEQEEQAAEQQNEQPQVVFEDNRGIGTAAPEGRVVIVPDATYAGTTQEASALEAAIAYYEAAERGDYTYTYNALHSADQEKYSYDEWLYANEELDSAAGEFEIFLVEESSGSAAQVRVGLTVYLADGSSSDRFTYFYYENGAWRHYLTMEEYEVFDSVL